MPPPNLSSSIVEADRVCPPVRSWPLSCDQRFLSVASAPKLLPLFDGTRPKIRRRTAAYPANLVSCARRCSRAASGAERRRASISGHCRRCSLPSALGLNCACTCHQRRIEAAANRLPQGRYPGDACANGASSVVQKSNLAATAGAMILLQPGCFSGCICTSACVPVRSTGSQTDAGHIAIAFDHAFESRLAYDLACQPPVAVVS